MSPDGTFIGFYDELSIENHVDELARYDDQSGWNGDTAGNWTMVRKLVRMCGERQRTEALAMVRERIAESRNEALRLAEWVLSQDGPLEIPGYCTVRGHGSFSLDEYYEARHDSSLVSQRLIQADYYPVIDVHVHPKMPDGIMMPEMREAGISHAVLLATDTQAEDMDRPEVKEWIRKTYRRSELRYEMSLQRVEELIRKDLRHVTHVTNRDVADWAADYPDHIIPFGSVNISRPAEYVEKTLDDIETMGLRGIKLLPYSMFADPSANENIEVLMSWCRKTGSVILTHSGLAAGVYESPSFSANNRPSLWNDVLTRYPDVPVIFAHFAAYSSFYPGYWMNDAIETIRAHDNAYADTAAITGILSNKEITDHIRKETGFSKVLFGTDYPMPHADPDSSWEFIVSKVKSLDNLTENEKHMLLGETAAELLFNQHQ